jgi:hypothetical protein
MSEKYYLKIFFPSNIQHYPDAVPSILKMEAACFSITLVPSCKPTLYQNPENCHLKTPKMKCGPFLYLMRVNLFIYFASSDPCMAGAHRILNLSHLKSIQGYLQKEIGYKKEIQL